MCGLAGIAGNADGKFVERSMLHRMIDVQRHRGPDECDVFIAEEMQAGIALTRLSIVGLKNARM